MIIKASCRANGGELAVHLLNTQDNEHVELYAIEGFMADTLQGAFQESYALSQGTRCTKHLFSVSLSPPKDADVSLADFEDAIQRLEDKLGLANQPKAIVFHEKDARRHCHVVYSRIDTDSMTAIDMPFYKNKLMEIAKELYLEHGWTLPQGFINRELKNPLHFTLQEWQQAKRLNDDPRLLKLALRECWSKTDDKPSFEAALERHGFYLAKGDRRSFVAVDWRGEVYSLSRWLGVKAKELKSRLGDEKELPTIETVKTRMDLALVQRAEKLTHDIQAHYTTRFAPIVRQKAVLVERQQQERNALAQQQEKRRHEETLERQARLNKGLRALWDHFTGRHSKIIQQNEAEAYAALQRDKMQKDALVTRQIDERRVLQERFDDLRQQESRDLMRMKEAVFSKLPEEKIAQISKAFEKQAARDERQYGMDMDFSL